jgi:hypothetical protein
MSDSSLAEFTALDQRTFYLLFFFKVALYSNGDEPMQPRFSSILASPSHVRRALSFLWTPLQGWDAPSEIKQTESKVRDDQIIMSSNLLIVLKTNQVALLDVTRISTIPRTTYPNTYQRLPLNGFIHGSQSLLALGR